LEGGAAVERLNLTVAPEDDGAEVYHLLRQRLHLSTALLRRLKTVPDGILLDGAHVTVRVRVRAGQILSILPEPEGPRRVAPRSGAARHRL
jgi:23S rRNA pseudouridine1911/1915/1917 synthase